MQNPNQEQHRYQCEVRWIIKRGIEDAGLQREYLAKVAKSRGKVESDRLVEAARAQYRIGNRGEFGRWETAVWQG